jgi:2,3-dihydroxybenzoate decarboxylase
LPADHPLVYSGHPELEGALWSWTCDTSAHVLRLIFSGVFDRHPGARVILGHMGEALPYMLWRLDSRAAVTAVGRTLVRPPSQTFRKHFVITTSGVCADAPFHCALEAMGDENVMFSVDYPYEDMQLAADWIDNAKITEQQRLKICSANATRVLRLC